jgi:CBS domain-containing protein
MPEEPKQELLIAAAGPAVTLIIALVLFGVLRATGEPLDSGQLDPAHTGLAQQVMWLNVALLLFNLLPIFPMDGGRMLRALLAMRLGLQRATRVAARVGQAGAVVLGLWGLGFFAPWGLGSSVVLVLIAIFVFFAGGAEAASVETRTAGRGLTVREMMITQFVALPVHATLQHAVDALLAGEQGEFPVVDNWGHVEGVLTRDGLIRGLSQLGGGASVERAMTANAPTLPPDLPFEEALERLGHSGLPALPVVDQAGGLVGLLTRDNVSDVLLVRRAGIQFPPRKA